MAPAIRDGDRVLVAPVRTSSLQVGDVVKFWLDGAFCLHRLVRRSDGGDWFEFQGDRLRAPDPRVSPAAIIGRAVAIERAGRQWRLDSLPARVLARGRAALLRLRPDEGGAW